VRINAVGSSDDYAIRESLSSGQYASKNPLEQYFTKEGYPV
jgi:hypothetical protein